MWRKWLFYMDYCQRMPDKPIISICIPAYNRCKTLKEWLESIVAQFDGEIEKKVEIVIADDASPDTTIESMVREFMKKYSNIKYHRYPKNMWLSSNLVHVTTYADGEYLRLMADDDCMTNFALRSTLEIIEKTDFDLMICNGHFGPEVNVHIHKKANTFREIHWMKGLVDYLYNHRKNYQDLVVFFQFYSILVVKNSYFKKSLSMYDKDFIYDNIFPQDIIIYSNIKDKKIIIPDNIFVLGRTLNESYKASMKFVTDFKLAMDMIEEANRLQWSKKRKTLKRIVISWWKKTILLWKILRRLHIDYKKNMLFRKLYFFYKKYMQNQTA